MNIRVIAMMYIGYTVFSVSGLIMIKYAYGDVAGAISFWQLDRTNFILLSAGLVLYIGSFVIWLMILRNAPLSTAYPVAVGLTLVCSTLAAFLILRESIGALKVIGIFLIVFGMILIFRDSSSV